MIDLVVLGSGNADIVRLIEDINSEKKQYNFLGFLEEDPTLIGNNILGYEIIGNDDLLKTKFSQCAVVNNVMFNTIIHKKVFEKIKRYKISKTPSLIHPSVTYKYSTIGLGNIVYENVNIATGVNIGHSNILYPGTNLGHECIIGNYNLLALNSIIGARTIIGNENVFGNSSTISLGLKIGDNNMIGVGSTVIKNVSNKESLLGNPAIDSIKVIKQLIKNK